MGLQSQVSRSISKGNRLGFLGGCFGSDYIGDELDDKRDKQGIFYALSNKKRVVSRQLGLSPYA